MAMGRRAISICEELIQETHGKQKQKQIKNKSQLFSTSLRMQFQSNPSLHQSCDDSIHVDAIKALDKSNL